MRDVDLLVGVASVGNDAKWSDGGPDGRHRDYWQTYSFGNLSATAATRRVVLADLLLSLRIAQQCKLQKKFLVVKGELRTYKSHLGSGNVLMSPNDQYLCIVPRSRENLALPFEGDTTLSIIISPPWEAGAVRGQAIGSGKDLIRNKTGGGSRLNSYWRYPLD